MVRKPEPHISSDHQLLLSPSSKREFQEPAPGGPLKEPAPGGMSKEPATLKGLAPGGTSKEPATGGMSKDLICYKTAVKLLCIEG